MGKYHAVAQGECFSSLADRHGFENYLAIYNHPENAELIRERLNPNVLYPRDVVFIPDNELKEVDAATEQTHRFVLKKDETLFRLVVKDDEEKPFANLPYELKIDGRTWQDVTDGDGKLEQKIPAKAIGGRLFIYSDETGERKLIGAISLKLGHLDPVEKISGVQSRLNNLGFGCGRVDGILGKQTAASLKDFQRKNGLPATGEADAATRAKLKRIHDWE